MIRAFSALRRLFAKEAPPEPGSIVEESWKAELVGPEGGRVELVAGQGYEGRYLGAAELGAAEASAAGNAAGEARAGPRAAAKAAASRAAARSSGREGAYELRLDREALFAWAELKPYRYGDFLVEGRLALRLGEERRFGRGAEGEASAGAAADGTRARAAAGGARARAAAGGARAGAAAGFLFRYVDEENFYAFLVSDSGHFRLDVVFNAKPRSLVPWTELPASLRGAESLGLGLLARDNRFLLFAEGEWLAEFEDESFRVGGLAFAAQLYPAPPGEGPRPAFHARLLGLALESRPLEVEADYYRLSYLGAGAVEARCALAESWAAAGDPRAALVQLRKLEKAAKPGLRERLLEAACALRLELYEEAERAARAALELEPGCREARLQLLELLYRRSAYFELREETGALLAPGGDEAGAPAAAGNAVPGFLLDEGDEARLRLLRGHARFNLGDYRGAAEDYGRAAELEPGQPLLWMNRARALESAKDKAGAAEAYLLAAKGFEEAEAEADLDLALARLAALRPRDPARKAIEAKRLFRSGKRREALALMEKLIAAGSGDSALSYLAGLVRSEAGDREGALPHFERALALEPDYPLYAFRSAECRYLLAKELSAAADEKGRARAAVLAEEAESLLARARAAAPEDGWIRNLSGLMLLDRDERGAARVELEAACAALPGEAAPAINLAELEGREGRHEAALARLAPFSEHAEARNQAGNLLARAAERGALGQGGRAAAGAADPAGAADAAGAADPASVAESAAEARDALLERALREYRAATNLDPANPSYEVNRGAVLFELERYSEAEDSVRRSLSLLESAASAGRRVQPADAAAAYLLAGNLARVLGDRPRAEAAYRMGLELSPRDPALLLALGRAKLAEGRGDKAEECRAALAELDPGRAARLQSEILAATTTRRSCASCGREWRHPRLLPPQSAAAVRAMPPDEAPAGACPSCGKVFCVGCRKAELRDNRLTCPDCGEVLKLADDGLRWLLKAALKG